MTNSQTKQVEYLRQEALKVAKEYHRNGEIKNFKITECGYFVSVEIEIGNAGDEDTLAAIFCREDCLLFIGKRGKITYPVWDKVNCTQVTRPFSRYNSVWQVYYNQKNHIVKG